MPIFCQITILTKNDAKFENEVPNDTFKARYESFSKSGVFPDKETISKNILRPKGKSQLGKFFNFSKKHEKYHFFGLMTNNFVLKFFHQTNFKTDIKLTILVSLQSPLLLQFKFNFTVFSKIHAKQCGISRISIPSLTDFTYFTSNQIC